MIPAWLAIGLLAGWLLITAVTQIRLPTVRRLRRLDPLGLLPKWNLFSPRPIVSDLVVRYRPYANERQPLAWSELPYPGPRRLTDGVFTRHRRAKRALYWQATRVVALYGRYRAQPMIVINSVPYRHLLARVAREVRGSDAVGVQFQVIKISGETGSENVVPLFRSAVHKV